MEYVSAAASEDPILTKQELIDAAKKILTAYPKGDKTTFVTDDDYEVTIIIETRKLIFTEAQQIERLQEKVQRLEGNLAVLRMVHEFHTQPREEGPRIWTSYPPVDVFRQGPGFDFFFDMDRS